MNEMKALLKLITGTILLIGSNLAMAHPGHQGESLLADVGHSFSRMDYFLGLLVVCVLIYNFIKRTD